MPPSHRSSSSHHSHSHSHHSSHSYSSHSSRSYSSRSSSSRPYSSGSYRAPRARYHQPTGYTNRVLGFKPTKSFRCKTHDYIYYPVGWFDETSGKSYRAGYYDESGEYYESVILKEGSKNTVQLTCAYCGTDIKTVWDEGAIPQCPNCGANLKESVSNAIVDELENDNYFAGVGYDPQSANARSVNKVIKIVLIVMAVQFAASFLITIITALTSIGGIFWAGKKTMERAEQIEAYIDSNIEMFGRELYVDSIGRTITWSDEYDSYYDSVSDCYVVYRTDEDPYVWQYWYEGISSDFGEYGWMEYEISEDQWYIERGNDNWIKLPSRYDTTNLWHFEGEQAGMSYYEHDSNLEIFGESIRIVDEDLVLYWDEENEGYYNPDADCYAWYNTYVTPSVWQYWYSEISPDNGWLEFDEETDNWYSEIEEGNWALLPQREYESNMWHIEGEVVPN